MVFDTFSHDCYFITNIMKVHILHGIHSSEGDKSTPARLIPELTAAGHECVVHDYGYVLALTTRWKNPGRAREIAPKIMPGDLILAHSNGCDITRLMLEMGIAPSGCIFLQPALDRDTIFPEGNYWINVFYNHDDFATLLARLFLFNHPYGSMGRYGYKGNDPRITNYDVLDISSVGGHSDPYRVKNVRKKVVESIK